MAYIPRMTNERSRMLATASGSGAASAAPGTGSVTTTSAPQPDSGGTFQGLREYFTANAPNASALGSEVASGIDSAAQAAVQKAGQSSHMYESQGGADLAAQATQARDDALGQLDAARSVSGISSMLEDKYGNDPNYTPGQRTADAALLARTTDMQGLYDKWGGILSALNPTYVAGAPTPPPSPITVSGTGKPNTDKSGGPTDMDAPDHTRQRHRVDPETGEVLY